jgi:hypothetical protein
MKSWPGRRITGVKSNNRGLPPITTWVICMKFILRFLSWVWATAIISFVVLLQCKSSGAGLPAFALTYFDAVLAFLKSLQEFGKPLHSSGVFPIVFFCGWFGVCFYLGKVSGWQRMAERYAGNFQVNSAATFNSTSARVGEIRHNGSLKVFADDKGIYLEVFFPFKFGHKDLFIPWQDISKITRVEGLSDSKHANILNKIASVFSSSVYIDLKLTYFREQKLIIRISEDFKRILPKNLLDSV